MFDRIRLIKSGSMGAVYTDGLLRLYIQEREKDFIEGVVHELTEQTLFMVIGNFNTEIAFSNEYLPASIEHIITLYSYPYETIEKQFSLLDKLFEKPEKPKELWK